MRQRLLCATDLTTRSDHAVMRAAQLARQMDAEVLFLHAVDETQPGRVIRMKTNRAQLRLLSQSERAMRHAPQDAEVTVRLGKPLQAIAEAAREWNPDLIVMAAPKRRRLDLLIGTTAERVIRATQRPVLIVTSAGQQPYDNVVLATDLSSTSVHVARTVTGMGMLANAYAWIVHAFEPAYQGMIATTAWTEDQALEHKRQWREALSRELLRELDQTGVDLSRVQVSAEEARPLDAIRRTIERVEPQLLVIGASRWFMLKRILFGSVADQVLRTIDCDILAISPPATRRSWARAA